MKELTKFTNEDKLKLLHDLFPKEITDLLDDIQAFCADFKEQKEEYEKKWTSGLMPFDFWQSLSEETAGLIQKNRFNLIKSSRVFSEKFSYTYTVLFVNDRIIKYADSVSTNEKFKQAVILLFHP